MGKDYEEATHQWPTPARVVPTISRALLWKLESEVPSEQRKPALRERLVPAMMISELLVSCGGRMQMIETWSRGLKIPLTQPAMRLGSLVEE